MGWLGRLLGVGKEKAEAAPVPQGFPFETITVPGAEALQRRAQMAAEAEGRFVPIILGGPDDVADLLEVYRQGEQAPEDILFASRNWTAEAVLQTLQEALDEDEDEDPDGPGPVEVGEWPDDDAVEPITPTAHIDARTRKPFAEVIIARIPCASGWQAPAYLRFGDWFACPPPEQHVALLRDWQVRYGAEVIAITGSSIECSVTRRPADESEALALAREMVAYCPDLLDFQDTLSEPAASLMVSDFWFFWWDADEE